MLDATAPVPKLSREQLAEREPSLRLALLNAQFDCRQAAVPVVLLLTGNDHVGANEVLDRLHEWMDARGLDTSVFEDETDEERERPRFWRYWRALPARGRTAVLLGAWAGEPIVEREAGKLDADEWADHLRHSSNLEEEWVADGVTMLKIFLFASPASLEHRIERARRKPDSEPYVEKRDAKALHRWESTRVVAEEFLRATDTDAAPWHVVRADDAQARDVAVVELLIAALTEAAERGARPRPAEVVAPHPAFPPVDIPEIESVTEVEYDHRKKKLQGKVARLSRKARRRGIATVLVFEGGDAAGKGGAIRRVTQALAARDSRVTPIAAPTEEERRYHYLWRFWRALPRAGRVQIFDRSWYGRVLVERVERFASEAEWRRAYDEINDFEEQLVGAGIRLVKFWLEVSEQEQLRRFQARENTPYKQYKITDEDWRNRGKRDQYAEAVAEMVARTSTPAAPWTLVNADDKHHARLVVLRRVVDVLGDGR
ncbi:MAG: polyphosphate:AMP phosphotransferase [Gemmatimonadetes bacterium]|nr:polyphosphate:AMP phosphotransferase [Gemmatimonadota bacterium]